jgi:signal transduction histidine kinase
MKRAETLLARAMDVSPTVFALFDADDHLVIANRQYRDQYETEAVPIVPGIVFEDIIHAFAAKVGIGGTEEETETWVAKRLSRREHPAKGFEYRRGDGDWIEVSDHLLDDGSIFTVGLITTERKQSEERLRQAQKMEAVGQLTGGVAHDFNNLLAVIVGNAELLGERLGVADHQVAAVLRAAGRGAELTQRLLAFSRRQPLKPQAIDLAARVAGMTELLTRTLGATIEISVASTPGLWRASADPGQLESALLNLAINARDAMPEGGRLSISSANASLEAREIVALLTGQAPEAALEAAPEAVTGEPGDPGDYVVLSVSDTGAGMSPAVLARVFEPFFTTKDVGQGSGLGLSMVYGFARQSGGFAAIESAPGRGTTVRLYLPRAEAEAPALEVSAPGARNRAGQLPCGHGETVLLLEDARDVRELASVLLEDLGYRVLAAAEAAEAGALLAENPGVDLLLTDVTLPGGRSGPDFAETARRHDPALKVLFMSGYPTEALMQRAGSLGRDTPLLAKPFRKAALAKAVRNALDDGDEAHGTE